MIHNLQSSKQKLNTDFMQSPCCFWKKVRQQKLCTFKGISPSTKLLPLLHNANVTPTSKVHVSTMLVLLTEIKMCDHGVASNGRVLILNFIEVCPVVTKLKHADRQTDTVSPMCIQSVCIMHRTYTNIFYNFKRKILFHTKFVSMFVIYFHIISYSHQPGSWI